MAQLLMIVYGYDNANRERFCFRQYAKSRVWRVAYRECAEWQRRLMNEALPTGGRRYERVEGELHKITMTSKVVP